MHWNEIRQAYPNQWLVIEALEAHTEHDQRRFDRTTLTCDARSAMNRRATKQHPMNRVWRNRILSGAVE